MQGGESKLVMQKQRAGPAAPGRRHHFFAASGRLEQRAEAAQERRVVCIFVCGCEASTPLCWARCWRGAGALAAAEATRVAEGLPESVRCMRTALRDCV